MERWRHDERTGQPTHSFIEVIFVSPADLHAQREMPALTLPMRGDVPSCNLIIIVRLSLGGIPLRAAWTFCLAAFRFGMRSQVDPYPVCIFAAEAVSCCRQAGGGGRGGADGGGGVRRRHHGGRRIGRRRRHPNARQHGPRLAPGESTRQTMRITKQPGSRKQATLDIDTLTHSMNHAAAGRVTARHTSLPLSNDVGHSALRSKRRRCSFTGRHATTCVCRRCYSKAVTRRRRSRS